MHLKTFPVLFLLITSIFADSLDNLQNLVENKFCDIRDVGRKPFSFPGHPCTSEHLQVSTIYRMSSQVILADACAHVYVSYPFQILVKAVPIKQGHTLRILWPITPNVRCYKEGPCKYISHLIGHEGEGSLFYILKKLGKLCVGVLFLFTIYESLQHANRRGAMFWGPIS
jgi:insulysin